MKDDEHTSSASARDLFASLGSVSTPAGFEQQVALRSMMQALPPASTPPGFEASVLQKVGNAGGSDSKPESGHEGMESQPQPQTPSQPQPQTPSQPQPLPQSEVQPSNLPEPNGVGNGIGSLISWFGKMSSTSVAASLLGLITCAGLAWYWLGVSNSEPSKDAAQGARTDRVVGASPATRQGVEGKQPTDQQAQVQVQTTASAQSNDVQSATSASSATSAREAQGPKDGLKDALNARSLNARRVAPKARTNKNSVNAQAVPRDSTHIIRGVKIPKRLLEED